MRKWVATICMVFFLAFSASHTNATERIAFSTLAPAGSIPFGISSQVLFEAFDRIGVAFSIESYPGKRSLEIANLGLTDGEGLRIAGIEKDYPNLIRLPVAITEMSLCAYARSDVDLSNGWDSLKDARVVIVRGMALATRLAEKHIRTIYYVASPARQIQYLAANKADVLIGTANFTDPLIASDEFKRYGIRKLVPPLATAPLYAYLNRKHLRLVVPLTKALQEMKEDGSITRCMENARTP